MGGVGWKPQGSSTTSCAGKADHGFGVCMPLALICLLKIVNYKLFYYIKNLKSRLYAAKFFKILKFVFLSEVADKSFCIKFSGLISKLKILKKSYLSLQIFNIETYIFKANKIYGAPMKPSKLFCFKDTKNFAASIFFLVACNKKFQRANATDIA